MFVLDAEALTTIYLRVNACHAAVQILIVMNVNQMGIAPHAMIHLELAVVHAALAIPIFRGASVVILLPTVLGVIQHKTINQRLFLTPANALTNPMTLEQAVPCAMLLWITVIDATMTRIVLVALMGSLSTKALALLALLAVLIAAILILVNNVMI